MEAYLNDTIKKNAQRHGLNYALVMAVCEKESGFDTYAMRYEPHWRWFLNPYKWAKRVATTEKTERIGQMMSWGLMQVMGTVARENGFSQDYPRLCRPDVGLDIGCAHLKKLCKRHGDLRSALAAYNAGRPTSKAGLVYADHVLSLMGKYV